MSARTALGRFFERAARRAVPDSPGCSPSLEAATARVRSALRTRTPAARTLGLREPEPAGQLLRPLLGWLAAGTPDPDGEAPLFDALAAIQLAHDASLLHDDVVDGAAARRDRPTLSARHGTAAALLEGDHVLTAAYRFAARSGSLAFTTWFADAVERTVAGEKRQAAARGAPLDLEAYAEIVEGKSGELFGIAAAAGALLRGDLAAAAGLRAAGRRLGRVYQMTDDLLDWCPHAGTGKPALQDEANGVWTWPAAFLPGGPSGVEGPRAGGQRFFSGGSESPARRALAFLRTEAAAAAAAFRAAGAADSRIREVIAGWVCMAADAVAREELFARDPVRDPDAWAARVTRGARLADAADWTRYFAAHARTFRFAARLFPGHWRRDVAGVYAFCRFTDDLADRQADLPPALGRAVLEEWEATARRAYEGEQTGIALLDEVMGTMRERGVPFRHVEDLVAGIRTDVDRPRFETMDELRRYTWRVASVVGLWLTELAGVRERAVLHRAATMGHAMQLTNVLRDIGEDLRRGRRYLPGELMARFGVSDRDLEDMASGRRAITPAYQALLEHLLQEAEEAYRVAFPALAALPGALARPAAVAARAYEGIHAALRRNGYDNFRRRAATGPLEKLALGAGALRDLGRLRGCGPLRRAVPQP